MNNKIFSLEALNAFHGDCLLLHYGTTDKPKLILIDGGPAGTFENSLRPRLEELRSQRNRDPLVIDHVMVTHLDNDHITGVLHLINEIESGDDQFFARSYWFNTFEDAMKHLPAEIKQAKKTLAKSDKATINAAVEHASINEGRSLRDAVIRLQGVRNGNAKFLFAEGKGQQLDIDGLRATLICPDARHLAALGEKWRTTAVKNKATTAAYVDTSVFNLSSIVVVLRSSAAKDAPSILLTGDARGDHILAGLSNANMLSNEGTAHFSVLKVPHHGSDRNLTLEFFQAVSADFYVISGDGKYSNPSEQVLEWIAATAPKEATICMTYDQNTQYPKLSPSIDRIKKRHAHFEEQLCVRGPNDALIRIDLLHPLDE
ncbi:Beta-lactamase superfamily domain-containing protein [Janthinobacterium lividum]|uniref:Beta-lactamase superfamily domain-containing protein n=1 Tax=Janthinobacterium lividum TaxID=29581 RepID=A0AB38C7F3_9BURK|nr:MBL fold metallo-hydrolase [Janthinobacterium lividum]SFX47643.1 Beta-lactamase superfamily domain-containing protein [Janthinobacterium lividum]